MKKINMWYDSLNEPWRMLLMFLIASPFLFSPFIPGFDENFGARLAVGAYVAIVVLIRMWWSLYRVKRHI